MARLGRGDQGDGARHRPAAASVKCSCRRSMSPSVDLHLQHLGIGLGEKLQPLDRGIGLAICIERLGPAHRGHDRTPGRPWGRGHRRRSPARAGPAPPAGRPPAASRRQVGAQVFGDARIDQRVAVGRLRRRARWRRCRTPRPARRAALRTMSKGSVSPAFSLSRSASMPGSAAGLEVWRRAASARRRRVRAGSALRHGR